MRSFGTMRAVGPLSVMVAAGERVALVGPNGSGKSTFLRLAAGTLTPSAGSLTINGVRAGTRAARAAVGASLSQERSFYLRLTGTENLRLFAGLRLPVARARERVREVIEELELADIAARRVDRCSTGMVQQLALARALIPEPPIVLLDEPTRSLDDDAIARMWAALDRRSAATVLVATHREEDIARCGRVIDLRR